MAEVNIGQFATALGINDKMFISNKVWANRDSGGGEAVLMGSLPNIRVGLMIAFSNRRGRHLRHRAQDDQEADASQATGDQDQVAQDNARPHRENRCLGETDAERASELLRSLG
jgi:hypothetical protein